MTLKEAYSEARYRACLYGGEDCLAAHAWSAVAKRRRTRTTLPEHFSEALEDARASQDPDLIKAVETIAQAQIHYCERFDTPRAKRIADNIRRATA